MSVNRLERAPFECLPTRLGRLGVDDLDGAVRRTRSESFSVVVKLGVDHVIVRCFNWDRIDIGGCCANHVARSDWVELARIHFGCLDNDDIRGSLAADRVSESQAVREALGTQALNWSNKSQLLVQNDYLLISKH